MSTFFRLAPADMNMFGQDVPPTKPSRIKAKAKKK
jgi:hypothetical protein